MSPCTAGVLVVCVEVWIFGFECFFCVGISSGAIVLYIRDSFWAWGAFIFDHFWAWGHLSSKLFGLWCFEVVCYIVCFSLVRMIGGAGGVTATLKSTCRH